MYYLYDPDYKYCAICANNEGYYISGHKCVPCVSHCRICTTDQYCDQ